MNDKKQILEGLRLRTFRIRHALNIEVARNQKQLVVIRRTFDQKFAEIDEVERIKAGEAPSTRT